MQIHVVCPECKTDYHLDGAMLGKHMRCPNSLCGAIFEVQDAEQPAKPTAPVIEPPPPKPIEEPKAKHVADIIPILPTQPVVMEPPVAEEKPKPSKPPVRKPEPKPAVEKPEEPAPKPSWQDAPPPVREKHEPSVKPVAVVAEEPDADLDELLFPSEAAVDEEPAEADESLMPGRRRPRKRKSRAGWIIAGLVLLMAGGVSAVWLSMRGEEAGNEDQRYQKAMAFYKDGDFAEAVTRFQRLHRDFPKSARQQEYRMLAELSDVREPAYQSQESADATAKSLGRFLQFLKMYESESAFKKHQPDAWETLHRLHKELLRWAKQNEDRTLLQLSQQALAEAKKLPAPDTVNPHQEYRIAGAAIAELETKLAQNKKRGGLLERIQEMAKTPTAAVVQSARRLVREAGVNGDPAFQKMLTQIVNAHRASVVYTPSAGEVLAADRDDDVPSLLINPLHSEISPKIPASKSVVLALARGLLLALEPQDGAVRWARRVGIDTTELPVRLPRSDVAPEMLLVVSADRRTLSALDAADGRMVWTTPLNGPCLCRPVLVKNRAFVPTFDGRIVEIETTGGRVLGSYNVGQSISVGGVHQPGSPYLYVAADDFCVYVLDVVRRQCAAVLYTDHPSGSLRSPPVIVQHTGSTKSGLSAEKAKGVLMLLQADGLDRMTARLYSLPIREPDQPALKRKLDLRGWSWFRPYTDGSRVAMVTDAGELKLLGVREKGNTDPLLFPLVEAQQISVDRSRKGRAQIVHVDGDNFWVLAHRKLHRFQLTFKDDTGPQLLDRWLNAPVLGDPLHLSQALGERGSPVLYVVTGDATDAACWASAVHGDTGNILWKRQLGWLPNGNLLVWKSAVWGYDSHGLYRFHSDPKNGVALARWNQKSFERYSRKGMHARTYWLPNDGEATLFSAAAKITNNASHVLEIQSFNENGKAGQTVQVTLSASLAGGPARAKQVIVAPLSDGALRRIDVDQSTASPGPSWRSTQAESDAVAHVVRVGKSEFLVTDGHSGLQCLHWPQPNRWEKKGERALTFSIVSAPAILPGEPMRVCVADAANTVHLLQGERLRPVRKWRLSGAITAGPFVMGGAIAVIVQQRRLAWLNPDSDAPVWEYSFLADIVGRPLWTKNQVIVATAAGKFVALSDDAGRLSEWEYTIRADLEPVAGPVMYGPDRLFTPLSDGTVMLIPLNRPAAASANP